jgi:hypothetical protein
VDGGVSTLGLKVGIAATSIMMMLGLGGVFLLKRKDTRKNTVEKIETVPNTSVPEKSNIQQQESGNHAPPSYAHVSPTSSNIQLEQISSSSSPQYQQQFQPPQDFNFQQQFQPPPNFPQQQYQFQFQPAPNFDFQQQQQQLQYQMAQQNGFPQPQYYYYPQQQQQQPMYYYNPNSPTQ